LLSLHDEQTRHLALVLDHLHRHHRQLLDLMASGLADRDPVGVAEHVPARTPIRPMLDHLLDRPRRQQRPSLALMARLAAGVRPELSLPRRGDLAGGSSLGGDDELRELRPSRRSSRAIRSSCRATRFSSRWIYSSIRNNTATTTSRPW
jgi:hypothetical protein